MIDQIMITIEKDGVLVKTLVFARSSVVGGLTVLS
jgi:hypothetical protein